MRTPAFLSPYVTGDSPARLAQGLAVGAIATVIIGFGWAGWQLNGTVEKRVEAASQSATVAALAPICADRFAAAAADDSTLVASLEAVSYWQRDSYLMKDGWATFAGGAKPDSDVAEACADMLKTALKLE